MSHTRDWTESSPTNDDWANEIDDFLRYLARDVRERMELEHYWNNETDISQDDADGRHKPGQVSVCLYGTQAQIDAISPRKGSIAYNTTTGRFQIYDGSAWHNFYLPTEPTAFKVRVTQKFEVGTSYSYKTVEWDTEDYDYGDNFDLANYKFVAPSDGLYLFTAQLTLWKIRKDTDAFHTALYVGSDMKAHGSSVDTDFGDMKVGSTIASQLKLDSGDEVTVKACVELDAWTRLEYTSGYQSTFEGILLCPL